MGFLLGLLFCGFGEYSATGMSSHPAMARYVKLPLLLVTLRSQPIASGGRTGSTEGFRMATRRGGGRMDAGRNAPGA